MLPSTNEVERYQSTSAILRFDTAPAKINDFCLNNLFHSIKEPRQGSVVDMCKVDAFHLHAKVILRTITCESRGMNLYKNKQVAQSGRHFLDFILKMSAISKFNILTIKYFCCHSWHIWFVVFLCSLFLVVNFQWHLLFS